MNDTTATGRIRLQIVYNHNLLSVFRVRDILVRIRILGSVPLTSGSHCDPALFVKDLQDANKKYFFSCKFECFFLFEDTFTSFFENKNKSHKEVTKQKKSRFFFIFLLVDGRVRIWIRIRTNKLRIRMRIQEAQKH